MDLSPYKNIVVFGGSFDPPHIAHVKLPQLVREAINADLVLYIPSGRAPHKLHKKQTSTKHRLKMLQLALDGIAHVKISTIEIDRSLDGKPTYTVDTLEELSKLVSPDTTLRLLFGADQLRIFDQWYKPQRIEELAEPVVMVRPPDNTASLLATLPSLQREKWKNRLVELPLMDISSTQIRSELKTKNTNPQCINPKVFQYIQKHHLYITK